MLSTKDCRARVQVLTTMLAELSLCLVITGLIKPAYAQCKIAQTTNCCDATTGTLQDGIHCLDQTCKSRKFNYVKGNNTQALVNAPAGSNTGWNQSEFATPTTANCCEYYICTNCNPCTYSTPIIASGVTYINPTGPKDCGN